MKLLLALHGFPPETDGGTERTVAALATVLSASGCEVTLLAGSLLSGSGRTEHRALGLRLVRLHRADLYFESWHKAYSPAVSREFSTLLDELRPDVVHVHHWLRLSSDLLRLARTAGCAAVATCHDYFTALARPVRRVGETEATPPPSEPYVSAAEAREAFACHRQDFADELRAAHLRLAPSRAHAEGLTRAFGGALAFRVMPPPQLAGQLPRKTPATPRGRRLLTWGSLYPDKGLESVLRALAAAREHGWSLTVLGAAHDAAFAAHLRALAEGLPVTFAGAFTPADLQLAVADYALLPSLADESYGLVLDEAMQLGLPVIAADVPAYRERAPIGCCALYRPGDHDALAALLAAPATLERLLPPPPPNLATPEQVAAELLGCYREAVARRHEPFRAAVDDRLRAELLFRRAERRLWTALQQANPPAPPDDFLGALPLS